MKSKTKAAIILLLCFLIGATIIQSALRDNDAKKRAELFKANLELYYR